MLKLLTKLFSAPPVVQTGLDLDSKFGIDTETITDRNFFRRLDRWLRGFTIYQATPVAHIEIVKQIACSAGVKKFIDLGSGKGRLLITMAPYFESLVGVEYFHDLHKIAKENCQKLGLFNVQLINENVQSYIVPDEPAVIYMFNPFGESVLRNFLQLNLTKFTDKHVFVYVNPLCLQTFLEFGFCVENTKLKDVKIFRRLGSIRSSLTLQR